MPNKIVKMTVYKVEALNEFDENFVVGHFYSKALANRSAKKYLYSTVETKVVYTVLDDIGHGLQTFVVSDPVIESEADLKQREIMLRG